MPNRLTCGLTLLMTLLSVGACSPKDESNEDAIANVSAAKTLETASEEIVIKMKIDDNGILKPCAEGNPACYTGTLIIHLAEQMPSNWRIVFSHLSPISEVQSKHFNLVHLNGDLHEITPKQSDLNEQQPYSIQFKGNTPLVSESVLFPNYLLIAEDGEAKVITSTLEKLLPGHQLPRPAHVEPFSNPAQQLRGPQDEVQIASAQLRFETNKARFDKATIPSEKFEEHRVVPQVKHAQWSGGSAILADGLNFPFIENNIQPALDRLVKVGLSNSEKGLPVSLNQSASLGEEGYQLVIDEQGIEIQHSSPAGLQYGLYTIAQLFDAESNSLPLGSIIDEPDMEFRGLHLDVSRNFRDKGFVLQLLDQMAYFKLNKLHLHLADDEGWRLEIPSLPELTNVGAYRCADLTEQQCLLPQLAGGNGQHESVMQNSGYYSTADYLEILRFAQERHIEVIPSLDMPGHSRAAIVAMQARHTQYSLAENISKANEFYLSEPLDKSQYRSIQHYSDNTLNPCLPATYRFVQEVLNQLISMHEQADVNLERYHIGADETAGAWQDSPACASLIASNPELNEVADLGPYFIERVAVMVNDLGIIPAAWSDGLSHANPGNLPTSIQSNAWGTLYSGAHNEIHQMVNRGWDVVLSTPDVLYFDFPYEADPVEPGYYWGSRSTDTYQVFQFMPNNLPVHAEIWRDKFGSAYAAKQSVNLDSNRSVLGIQAQLWSETVRSNKQANYMLFPRLFAVAERAWHSPKWAEEYSSGTEHSNESGHFDRQQHEQLANDWIRFSQAVSQRIMPKLIEDGVIPRVPLPGAVITQNKLHMNSNFPGLILEYRTGNQDWQIYSQPIAIGSAVDIRSRVPTTQVVSRVQSITNFSEND